MKMALRLAAGLLAGAFLMLLAGCQAVQTQVTPSTTGLRYPPTNAANVLILNAPPAAPNIRIGEVRVEPASANVPQSDIQAAIRAGGAQLGADAVVIVQDSKHRIGAFYTGPWYDRTLNTVDQTVIVGMAIKFMTPQARAVRIAP
jgi:hypothetical protein